MNINNQKEQSFITRVTQSLQNIANKMIKQQGDIPFEPFCTILIQFTEALNNYSSILGLAFKDIIQKVAIIRNNIGKFPKQIGMLSFIKMQMDLKIHTLNGKNNNSKKAEKEYMNYVSTSRTLLRLMWFQTFCVKILKLFKEKPNQYISTIVTEAYDYAFSDKHSWFLKNGARLAFKSLTDKQGLMEAIFGKCTQQVIREKNDKYLVQIQPTYNLLWKFYKQNGLDKLE